MAGDDNGSGSVTIRFTAGELTILDAARKIPESTEERLNRSQYIRERVMAAATEEVRLHAVR